MEILLIIFCTALYFMPTLVGYKKRNFYSIFALNLFLGWTFIGWVIAFVWALSKDRQDVVVIKSEERKSVSRELTELKKLYEDGVLTKLEFEKQKKRLLD